jgi:hypothetical protein|tara:strand:+ start:853 stop:1002 length:150 start_codon:yes stop_codon:yes gene_type:complete
MEDWSLLNVGALAGHIKVVFEQKHAKVHVDIEIYYSCTGELKGLVVIEE